MAEAFEGADIVYPKSWAPAAVMRERTRLLRAGERGEAERPRARGARDQRAVQGLGVHRGADAARRGTARRSTCTACPADVTGVSCAAGEVSREVFERCRLDTYREAEHKPFVIAAMILPTRFQDPAAVLDRCLQVAPLRKHG